MRKLLPLALGALAWGYLIALAHADPAPIAVDLTHDEAQAVLSLLDRAVKDGGLQAAKGLGPIADKLIEAARLATKADEDAKIKAAVDAAKAPVKP